VGEGAGPGVLTPAGCFWLNLPHPKLANRSSGDPARSTTLTCALTTTRRSPWTGDDGASAVLFAMDGRLRSKKRPLSAPITDIGAGA